MREIVKRMTVTLAGGTALSLLFVLLIRLDIVRPPRVASADIERSVNRHPELVDKAYALPTAAQYGRATYFQTHASFCGPATLVNVYRSLGEHVWSEGMVLEGSGRCRLGFCWMGLTLDELAEVARAHGRQRVTVLRDLSPTAFREHLRRSNDPRYRYTVNFTRAQIFSGGGGHHSPIGGYLEAEDRVLVIDVNPDFGAWLIERDRLYQAVNTLDGDTKRGLLLFESP